MFPIAIAYRHTLTHSVMSETDEIITRTSPLVSPLRSSHVRAASHAGSLIGARVI